MSHPLSSFTRCVPWLVTATLCCASAHAADDGLSGDWGGKRRALQDKGVEVNLGYTSEDVRVVRGGQRRASAHAGQLALGTRLDLEKLWGWDRTEAQVMLTQRDGHDVGERAGLGLLSQSAEVYGRGNISRLTRLWLRHESADGRWDIKAGRVGVGEDFASLDCTAMYLALCGGQPGSFAGDYWHNWPISQWGGRLQYRPAPQVYVRAGVYQLNPRYANTHGGGFRLAPSGTQGTLTPVELGWEPMLGGRQGRYSVGGWYSSAPRADALLPAEAAGDLGPMMRSGSYGGWFHAGQKLSGGARDDEQGLRAQLAYAQGDARTSRINRMLYGLLTWNGPLAARPQDQLGAGMALTWLNPRVSRQLAAPGMGVHPEQALEVFYGVSVMPGLRLQPTLQYIRHPGGLGEQKAAGVIGLKTQLDF